jgi:ADP-ribose pyrophosphatase YjhB (NUDIX family)
MSTVAIEIGESSIERKVKRPESLAPAREVAFCVHCAGRLIVGMPEEDGRRRLWCRACDYVHYDNPKVLVACFVSAGERILLCRRAIEPAYGRWSLPGGFVERGETLEQAAAREIAEEAGVVLKPEKLVLYGATSLMSLSQVYIMFRAKVVSRQCATGRESLQVKFFRETDVPWNAISYPAVAASLRAFFAELASNCFGVHVDSEEGNPCVQSLDSATGKRVSCYAMASPSGDKLAAIDSSAPANSSGAE